MSSDDRVPGVSGDDGVTESAQAASASDAATASRMRIFMTTPSELPEHAVDLLAPMARPGSRAELFHAKGMPAADLDLWRSSLPRGHALDFQRTQTLRDQHQLTR